MGDDDSKVTNIGEFVKQREQRKKQGAVKIKQGSGAQARQEVLVLPQGRSASIDDRLSGNKMENILFLPVEAQRLLHAVHNNAELGAAVERFGYAAGVAPGFFPNYHDVPAEAEPLFAYHREKAILNYMLYVVDATMRIAGPSIRGVMLADPRYMKDIADSNDEKYKPRLFGMSTRFRPKVPKADEIFLHEAEELLRFSEHLAQSMSLSSQYLDNLLDEKSRTSRLKWMKRKRISEQVQLFMSPAEDLFERFPDYERFVDRCADHTRSIVGEITYGGQNKAHQPMRITPPARPKRDPRSYLRLVK